MANVKPNEFPNADLPLTGDEEIYSQEGGTNEKYTVQDVWDGLKYVVNATGVPIPNYFIEFSGVPRQVYSAKIDFTGLAGGGTSFVHNLNVQYYIYVDIYSPDYGLFNCTNHVEILVGSNPNELEEITTNDLFSFDGYLMIHYIPNL